MEVDMDKRAYSDPEDPRNLFAAMYGGVYKREDPYDLRCGIYYYLQIYRSTGCCKTSVKLWNHITETLYGVFLVFLGSYDCQLWAIFHFGTLWA